MSGIAAHLPHPDAVAPVSNVARTPRHADAELRQRTARLGMWIFLAGEVLFFGAILLVYGVSRYHAPEAFAAASARTDVWLGTLNTALMLISSCCMAMAAEASECGRTRTVAPCLWMAAVLGMAFLAIKGIEYRKEWLEGLFPGPGFHIEGNAAVGAELFFEWYFFATALHAVHLGIGIALCIVFALVSRATTREVARRAGAPRIHVLALYWHFVDVVWIFLYPLIYLVVPRS